MGEEDTATTPSKQKRRCWRQIALATIIALSSAYGLPHWVSEGPVVLVVVAVVVIAVQMFAAAISASELWKLRTKTEPADVHHRLP